MVSCVPSISIRCIHKKEFHVTRGILCDLGSYVIRGVKLNVKRRQNDEKKLFQKNVKTAGKLSHSRDREALLVQRRR